MTNSPRDTIINGDCVSVLPQLAARSVDFILTDPPYIARYKARDGRTVPNDDNFAWLSPSFAEMYRVLRWNRYCVSFYGWPNAHRFVAAYHAAGFRVVGHFVFPKHYTSGRGHVRYQHECAYLLAKGRPTERSDPSAMSFRGKPTLTTGFIRRKSRSVF
jgi:DNA modification methylase